MIVDGYGPKKVKPISLDELEKYLWGAAVLLRGQIDATSYKEYIFPLVFFKRVCDVYDEAYNDAMILSDGDSEYAKADADHLHHGIRFSGTGDRHGHSDARGLS